MSGDGGQSEQNQKCDQEGDQCYAGALKTDPDENFIRALAMKQIDAGAEHGRGQTEEDAGEELDAVDCSRI